MPEPERNVRCWAAPLGVSWSTIAHRWYWCIRAKQEGQTTMAQPLQHVGRLPADHGRGASTGLRTTGYGITIVWDVTLLYAAHHLVAWGVPFLTPAFDDVLWAIDLSLIASIVANASFMAYDADWFRHFLGAALDGLSLLSVYVLYQVFPFTFAAPFWSEVTAVALLAMMLAIAIALIVEIVEAFVGGLKHAV